MKLKLLKLNNFRQFRGEQKLDISVPSPQNSTGVLTMIHGEMGHGKTTLLNAFRWCLHGPAGISGMFSGPNEIINSHVALYGESPSAEVILDFEHDNDHIQIKRTLTKVQQDSDRKDNRDGTLQLSVTSNLTGQTHVHEAQSAQRYIDAIIPLAICELLFFDGESINKLATVDENPKMGESVRTLLGLKLVESAIKCLGGKVLADLRKEDKDSSTGEEKTLKEARASKVDEKNELIETVEKRNEQLKAVIQEIKAYNEELKRKQSAKELQIKRENADKSLNEARKIYTASELTLKRLICEKGYILFCNKLIKDSLEITKRLRSERKIPAPIMTDFIKEILHLQKCICGRSLAPGSIEYDTVQKLLNVAKDLKFHDAAASLEMTIGSIRSVLIATRESFKSNIEICIAKRAEIRIKTEEMNSLAADLAKLGDPDVTAIENNRNSADDRRRGLEASNAIDEHKINGLIAEIEELDRRLKAAQKKSAANSYAVERVDLVEAALQDLKDTLKRDTESILPELQEMVNDSFSKMVEIPGRVALSTYPSKKEDEISIRVSLQTEVAPGVWKEDNPNAGKRQCLSLAFISSLVRFAEKRAKTNDTIMKDISGGAYPIVMDAAFANLDPAAKKRFAPQLGGLATQVIAMLNSDHYDEEFENGLNAVPGLVGNRYILVHHYTKPPEQGLRSIRIAGKDHAIMEIDEGLGYQWSEIRKIS